MIFIYHLMIKIQFSKVCSRLSTSYSIDISATVPKDKNTPACHCLVELRAGSPRGTKMLLQVVLICQGCKTIKYTMTITRITFINIHSSQGVHIYVKTTILLCKCIKHTLTITGIMFMHIHSSQVVQSSKQYNIALQIQ